MAIVILHRAALASAPYHRWLAEAGEPLFLLASAAKLRAFGESLDALPPHAYAEARAFEGYDTTGAVELAVLDIAARVPVTAIVAHAEFDMERAARLRARLGIAGQDEASAHAFRDKIAMKRTARAAGIPVADWAALEHAPGCLDFAERVGLPVVVKPRNGAGSTGIEVLRTPGDLDRFVARGFTPPLEIAPNLMMERFVSGRTYHVDGLVLDGRVALIWPSLYTTGSLDFLGEGGEANASHLLDAANPLTARLCAFVARVLDRFPTPAATTFHAEVFRTDEDELVLCEIASRTGGARICDALEACFGVNISEQWARAECGLPAGVPGGAGGAAPEPATLGGWALIAPREGTVARCARSCPVEGVSDYVLNVELGQALSAPQAATQSIASFVFRAAGEDEARARIDACRDWFYRVTEIR